MDESCSEKALVQIKHPGNYKERDEPGAHIRITGPCGDAMGFRVKADNGIITIGSGFGSLLHISCGCCGKVMHLSGAFV